MVLPHLFMFFSRLPSSMDLGRIGAFHVRFVEQSAKALVWRSTDHAPALCPRCPTMPPRCPVDAHRTCRTMPHRCPQWSAWILHCCRPNTQSFLLTGESILLSCVGFTLPSRRPPPHPRCPQWGFWNVHVLPRDHAEVSPDMRQRSTGGWEFLDSAARS